MSADLLEIWHSYNNSVLQGLVSHFLFLLCSKVWNMKVEENMHFFSFSSKLLKEMVISFEHNKDRKI